MNGHCGKMEMKMTVPGYKNLFHLKQLSESDYRLQLFDGKELGNMEYQLEFTGTERDINDQVINTHVQKFTIKACS